MKKPCTPGHERTGTKFHISRYRLHCEALSCASRLPAKILYKNRCSLPRSQACFPGCSPRDPREVIGHIRTRGIEDSWRVYRSFVRSGGTPPIWLTGFPGGNVALMSVREGLHPSGSRASLRRANSQLRLRLHEKSWHKEVLFARAA